jgi:hypothetical protein
MAWQTTLHCNVSSYFFQQCALGLRETAGPGGQHFTVNVALYFFQQCALGLCETAGHVDNTSL